MTRKEIIKDHNTEEIEQFYDSIKSLDCLDLTQLELCHLKMLRTFLYSYIDDVDKEEIKRAKSNSKSKNSTKTITNN